MTESMLFGCEESSEDSGGGFSSSSEALSKSDFLLFRTDFGWTSLQSK